MFALADCNNFYASCERAFNPKLKGKPIVVLSNNDGCIIARSQEAKQLGVPMGAPVFKYKNLIEKYNIHTFSPNFTLYGDMSHRVMSIFSDFIEHIEIYSIDEAFLDLDKYKYENTTMYIKQMRDTVLCSTGIPVSVGIAPTKTLAKICNHIAKASSRNKKFRPANPNIVNMNDQPEGVFNWNEVANKETLLKNTPVEEIWGVGWNTSAKMNSLGIYNALELRDSNDSWVRKHFTVMGLRTVTELREVTCYEMNNSYEPRKGIMSSRSFGKPVEKLQELEEAVATYTARACEKLREQESAASHIYVSIKTNMHREDQEQYFAYKITSLTSASWYPPDFIKAAMFGLRSIYKKDYKYKKATVMLLGIVPKNQVQLNLFQKEFAFEMTDNLMNAVDKINNHYGTDFIKYAATGMNRNWRMKSEKRSPEYTTVWEDIPTVRAG